VLVMLSRFMFTDNSAEDEDSLAGEPFEEPAA